MCIVQLLFDDSFRDDCASMRPPPARSSLHLYTQASNKMRLDVDEKLCSAPSTQSEAP